MPALSRQAKSGLLTLPFLAWHMRRVKYQHPIRGASHQTEWKKHDFSKRAMCGSRSQVGSRHR